MKKTITIPIHAPRLDHRAEGPLRKPRPAPANIDPLPIQVASSVPTRMYQGRLRPATMKSSLSLTDRAL